MESPQYTPPEQRAVYDGLRVTLNPAPFLRRLLAYCVDLGILYCALSAVVVVLGIFLVFFGVFAAGVVGSLRGEHGRTAAVVVITEIIAAVLVVISIQDIYFIYYERKHGATLGKKLFGLRVVSTDGSSVTLGQAFVRDLMRYFDCFLIVPALLSIAISKQNKRLGDLLAGTIVVYSEAREKSLQSVYLRHEEFETRSAGAQVDAAQLGVFTSDVRRRFLAVAFPAFVSGAIPKDSLGEWTEWVNGQCPSLNAPEIHQETRDRFMAELCFQQEQRKGK